MVFEYPRSAVMGIALGLSCLGTTPVWAQRPDSLTRVDSSKVQSLQEITVSAAPAARHDPVTSIRLPQAKLSRTESTSPWDLLRQTAGLEIHEQGQGPGFAPTASLRGFSSDHSTDMALWVDGVPINEPVNGHAEGYNDWSLLFPQAIRDIEVTRGPANPLYGNFAMAGAVNVRTIERMDGTRLWSSGGSHERLDLGVLTGLDRERTGLVVGGRYLHDGGWRPNSDYDLGQGHLRWVHQVSDRATLDAGVGLYATQWDSPGFITVDALRVHDWDRAVDPTDGGFKRRAQQRVSLRVIASDRLLWRSTVYATQGRWQLYLTIPPEGGSGEGSGSQTEEEDTRYGLGLTSALTYATDRAAVTLGLESRWDHADYQQYFTTSRARDSVETDVDARQASAGLFLASHWDLVPHLRIAVGGRVDLLGTRSTLEGGTLRDTKAIVTPKLGATYEISGFGDVHVNVSRGFRQADGVIEDPATPFITSWATEAGVTFARGPVRLGVTGFHVTASNEQTFDPIQLTTTSGGRSRRNGVDLDAALQLAPGIEFSATGTIVDAIYREFTTEDGESLRGLHVFNTAKYSGSLRLAVTPPRQAWFADVGTFVVGPYTPFDEPDVETDPYAVVQVSAGYRIPVVGNLRLGIRNLFNRTYAEVRAGGFVAPGQPRTVVASLEAALPR